MYFYWKQELIFDVLPSVWAYVGYWDPGLPIEGLPNKVRSSVGYKVGCDIA